VGYKKKGATGGGTTADRFNKVITIDINNMHSPEKILVSLAHETGHALYKRPVDTSSRDAFINSMLRDEGAATLKNIVVQREIIANGGPDIGGAGSSKNIAAYNQIYDQWNTKEIAMKEAEEAIGRVYGKGEKTSNTHEPYEDYYGGWYDRNIK